MHEVARGARSRGILLVLSAAGLLSSLPAAQAQDTSADQSDPSGDRDEGFLVLADRLSGALDAASIEDELFQSDIEGYGLNTIGELIDEVTLGLDESEDGPVVLVNGQLATGVEEIADLPTEAVDRIQLLPKDAAARLGQGQQRRVVNVVIKPNHRQATLNGEHGSATAGGGDVWSASAGFIALDGGDRSSITFKARDTAPLYEAQRGIVSATAGLPYDFTGNILPLPTSATEIDPALSALAGTIVSVAGVPSGAGSPSLAAFVAQAGIVRQSNLGRYRTLVGGGEAYNLSAVLSRRFGRRTGVTLNLNGDWSDARSLIGPPGVLLTVPQGLPYSPFTRPVSVARYLEVPLAQDRKGSAYSARLAVNTGFGRYNVAILANYQHRKDEGLTDRQTDVVALQQGVQSGTINPFADIADQLLEIVRRDASQSIFDRADINATVSGAPVEIPAGWISITARLGAQHDRQESFSEFSGTPDRRSLKRSEANGQFTLTVPLASRREEFLPALGELSVSASLGFRDPSDTRRLDSSSYSLDWRPIDRLSLRGSLNYEESAPSLGVLSDPLTIYDGVRFYDPLRAESVFVSFLSGGNPSLPLERRKVASLGANFQALEKGKLTLSADYSVNRVRDAVGGLPPLSADVVSAFPERFLRDGAGTLVQVDSRAVSFERDDREQFRWGINGVLGFGAKQTDGLRRLGDRPAPADLAPSDDGDSVTSPPTPAGARPFRVNFNLSHTVVLKAERLLRSGVPVVDLLNGGAQGYGSGFPRHIVVGAFGLAGRGFGLQTNGVWRSRSEVRVGPAPGPADLVFSSRTLFNMRLFAEMGTLVPDNAITEGMRITVSVDNLLDSRQRVEDRTGIVPQRYQPYLLDPLGRVIKIGLRKVF